MRQSYINVYLFHIVSTKRDPCWKYVPLSFCTNLKMCWSGMLSFWNRTGSLGRGQPGSVLESSQSWPSHHQPNWRVTLDWSPPLPPTTPDLNPTRVHTCRLPLSQTWSYSHLKRNSNGRVLLNVGIDLLPEQTLTSLILNIQSDVLLGFSERQ